MHLILYSRGYCHLCDDMQAALGAFRDEFDFSLDVIDVDADPQLVARYDELVPVLAARMPDGTIKQLCHYFLDADVLRVFLRET